MTSFLDKNGLQRYHNDIKGGLNEVKIQDDEPTSGKIWFDTDGQILIDPNDFDAEKQEVVVSNILPEADDHHKLWVNPDKGASPEDFIQSDWNSNDEASASYIRNKPTIDSQYDTSEIFTGKYWVDGKPIYRYVHIIDNLLSSTKAYSIPNLKNGETLVHIEFILDYKNKYYNIANRSQTNLNYVFFSTNYAEISMSNSDTSQPRLIATIEYTKTTD